MDVHGSTIAAAIGGMAKEMQVHRKLAGVLLVEDDPRLRAALSAAILGERSLQLTAVCQSGREALQIIRRSTLDLVLVSLQLPDGSGLDIVAAARRHQPLSQVMVMGSGDNKDLHAAIEAGATACVLKENLVRSDQALGISLIASVLFSSSRFPSSTHQLETSLGTTDLSGLLPVQNDILRHVASGATDKEIARRLALTSYNVDYHLRRLRKRFAVHNRVQLVRAASALFGRQDTDGAACVAQRSGRGGDIGRLAPSPTREQIP